MKIGDIINIKRGSICLAEKKTINFLKCMIIDITLFKNENHFIVSPVNQWNEPVNQIRYQVKQSNCY